MTTAICLIVVGVFILKVAIFNTLNTIIKLFDLHMKAQLSIKNEDHRWVSFDFSLSTALINVICWGYPIGLAMILVGVVLL